MFDALPTQFGARDERCTGVEIEFGGLEPKDAAAAVGAVMGGRLVAKSPGAWELVDTRVGKVKVYLDSALTPEKESWLAEIGISLGSKIIPMEIVTEPLRSAQLNAMEALIDGLRDVGGRGSRASIAYGFGLHLNPALDDAQTGTDLPRVACAYAVLERWLRHRDPVDISRRLLPFVEPFPRAFVQSLAQGSDRLDMQGLLDAIDAHIASRNHGLDLLPAYAALQPERFKAHHPDQTSVSARPAYHYRLPETRLGVAPWSLAYEWRRWHLIETVAADPALLKTLADAWLKHDEDAAFGSDEAYVATVTAALGAHAALAPEGGPAGGAA